MNRNSATANVATLSAMRAHRGRPAARAARRAAVSVLASTTEVAPVVVGSVSGMAGSLEEPGSATDGTRGPNDENGTPRVMRHVLADAPEEHAGHAADAAMADHHEVDLVPLGDPHQGVLGTAHRHLADRGQAEARDRRHGGVQLLGVLLVRVARPLLVAPP